VLAGRSAEARQQALFVVSLISSHPSLLANARARALAYEAEQFLARAARGRAEDSDIEAEWRRLSSQLTLLADDISVDGVNLAYADLESVSAVMVASRYKLLAALILVGVFLAALLLMIRRHFILPLQRIDRALAQLHPMSDAPQPPSSQMDEIHAIENAIQQLHAVMRDNEQARADLERLATTDALTGLHNRRHFMAMAEAEIERAHRYGRPITVALADLDNFKRVNDSYGHAAGDTALRAFSTLLADFLRQSDWACRYGGEEFAFIFPESSVDEVLNLASRLCEQLAALDIAGPGGEVLHVTVSLGLADASHCPLETALRAADEALYRAKSQGRNKVLVAAACA